MKIRSWLPQGRGARVAGVRVAWLQEGRGGVHVLKERVEFGHGGPRARCQAQTKHPLLNINVI